MKRTFDNIDTFYKDAMINITQQLGSKLRMFGYTSEDIPELVNSTRLQRWSSDLVDGIILEHYELDGITLIEVEWSKEGIKQRDINKDERDIRNNY